MSKNCGKQYLFLNKKTETGSTVGLIPAYCKSWSCPTCRKKKADIVKVFIKKNFTKQDAWMNTITFYHSGTALQAWIKIGKSLNRLLTYARKYTGAFNYVRVVEPHKDGDWPHIHLLTNRNIASTKFVKLITKWGFGWNFESQPWSGDKAGNYMSKYLTKEWPTGNADLLRQISKTRIVSNSRSLGAIFSHPPTWQRIQLPNPFRQLPKIKSAVIMELVKQGCSFVKYEPVSDGFIIEADSSFSPEFVECIEDQFKWDALEGARYCQLQDPLMCEEPF